MRLSQNDVLSLEILKELESFRAKLAIGELQEGRADSIIRLCEAIVADHTQWDTRAAWIAALKNDKTLEEELDRFTNPSGNTVRDVMKDRMRDLLKEYNLGNIDLTDLVANIADEAFSVCGIPEKEQDEEW